MVDDSPEHNRFHDLPADLALHNNITKYIALKKLEFSRIRNFQPLDEDPTIEFSMDEVQPVELGRLGVDSVRLDAMLTQRPELIIIELYLLSQGEPHSIEGDIDINSLAHSRPGQYDLYIRAEGPPLLVQSEKYDAAWRQVQESDDDIADPWGEALAIAGGHVLNSEESASMLDLIRKQVGARPNMDGR